MRFFTVSNTPVTTRFAPSPTGYMHIGNLRTALYAYLIAKHDHGNFILRIEDTDRERLVEGATDVILSTLKVTGLSYDEGPIVGGDHGPYIQSERKELYKVYADELVKMGKAYYCFCTKERLEQLHEDSTGGGYDRHCRDLSKEEAFRIEWARTGCQQWLSFMWVIYMYVCLSIYISVCFILTL